MRRSKRSWWERLWFRFAFRCVECGSREHITWLATQKITRYARCPECESPYLRHLRKRDRVDRFNKNPFRLIQSLTNANLYHCSCCRLQFYDVRPLFNAESELVEAAGVEPASEKVRRKKPTCVSDSVNSVAP